MLAIGGCTNKAELKHAKQSAYDVDFAIVFTTALSVTRDLYPKLDDAPGRGTVRTAWHPVPLAITDDDSSVSQANRNGGNTLTGAGAQTTSAMTAAGMPSRMARTQKFIRFDIAVIGGRPWRVRVTGHASEWQPGNAQPTDLTGAAKPPWLDARTDALRLQIYRRLRKFAVKMAEEPKPEDPADRFPKIEASAFVGLPPAAAAQLASLKNALVRRDNAAVRADLADDVVWSLGGEPGADTAMAMWQADPDTLDVMAKLVSPPLPVADGGAAPPGGCAGTAARVTCPGGAPTPGAWQLVLEPRGGQWRVTSFVKAE